MRLLYLFVFMLLSMTQAKATNKYVTVKGEVTDTRGESLIGATVQLAGTTHYAIVGLDGSFRIPNVALGEYSLTVRFVGYASHHQAIDLASQDNPYFKIILKESESELQEVLIVGQAMRGSELEARSIEKNAENTVNVVSSKAIELSPDITVANVVQRVSGLSLERNASGDPQYAIVRGMNKRYNYTLVNGIKIPSPDNKNRYVPLDIFPAQMLERLEVSKSLTADMEGDAIGGVVNMVMKSAPEDFVLDADFQLGHNQINSIRGFQQYDYRVVDRLSPYDRFGPEYNATAEDFTTANGVIETIRPMPDFIASLSTGGRLFSDRLGVMVGVSAQNSFRGVDSEWYDPQIGNFGEYRPTLIDYQLNRESINQQRYAGHLSLDYRVNKSHEISLYAGQYYLNDHLTRDAINVEFRTSAADQGFGVLSPTLRTRSTYQTITNTTLQGKHKFNNQFSSDWSAVYSLATNDRPDNLIFRTAGRWENFERIGELVERRSPRRWERHEDRDLAFYGNVHFHSTSDQRLKASAGFLVRDKARDSFFNRYTFDPAPATQFREVMDENEEIIQEGWSDFSEVQMRLINPRGTTSHPLNFNSYEQILAYYLKAAYELGRTDINAGLRVEHTWQGYEKKFPTENRLPELHQSYVDFLPSLAIKNKINPYTNLRASYYQAISRPGFFEIVDYTLNENDEFNEGGNPNLVPTRADNFDLRYEYFPGKNDQILVGAFYKYLQDPIEFIIDRPNPQAARELRPVNLGDATNWGIELDYQKFFNKIGIRANYTFTQSEITTDKTISVRENPEDPSSNLVDRIVQQTRPLQGQARHIGNLSIMYKNQKSGTDLQLAGVYTGERIEFVSPFLDNDQWMRPIIQLDFSAEQRIGKHWVAFVKINNLLNTPYELFIKRGRERPDVNYPLQRHYSQEELDQQLFIEETVTRLDYFYQSYRLGVRYKLF
ncbi:MAG: TonB-dependent receptor [Cyclobacteriaceae bacterium]|nr:TonB-dependent receptor [Cyclobacteriaceae bacterium]MCH8514803.1 TonB-dependent receptor [Cyclobacteriaceae bacterium]